jgi:hypothetical protein
MYNFSGSLGFYIKDINIGNDIKAFFSQAGYKTKEMPPGHTMTGVTFPHWTTWSIIYYIGAFKAFFSLNHLIFVTERERIVITEVFLKNHILYLIPNEPFNEFKVFYKQEDDLETKALFESLDQKKIK